jgi:restriction endonuclease S subunit
MDSTIFPDSQLKSKRVIDLVAPFKRNIVKKGSLKEPRTLIDLEDVQSKTSAILSEKTVTKTGSDKLEFGSADLVIGKIEPELGKILLNDEKERRIGSTEWIPLKLRSDRVTPAFLKYLLLNRKVLDALGFLKSGKIQARLPMDELLYLKLPIPSIEIQRALEPKLQKIDLQITDIAKSIEAFSRICDATFVRLYGIDKLNEPPRHFMASFSDVSLSRLMRIGFRQGTLTSKIRELEKKIPRWVSLMSLATVRGGKRLEKGAGYSSKPTKYRYLRNLDLTDGEIGIDSVKFISEEQHKSIRRYQVFENEIVMTIAGTVGKVSLMPKGLGTCNVTENLAVISSKASVVPNYLLYLLSSSIVQIQIQKEMSELRQQKLGLTKVRSLKMPKPLSKPNQREVANAISEKVKKMREKKATVHDLLSRAIMTVENAIPNGMTTAP